MRQAPSSTAERHRSATRPLRLGLASATAVVGAVWAANAAPVQPTKGPDPVATTVVAASLSSVQRRAGLRPPAAGLLGRAYALAARRVATRRDCADLFTNLGADGLTLLRSTLYYPSSAGLTRTCTRAYAVTGVGSAVTMLCPSFARLDVERGAMVLIHEALHHAGLPEAPIPGALRSSEINRAVWTRCF